MDLKEIASISGKGGLFKIVKPTRTGVVLESLDEKQQKIVATANHRISVLKEISVYSYNAEGSTPLEEVLYKIYEEFGDDPGVDSKSPNEELNAFLQHVLPDYDKDKVYPSDIKKIVSWYKILLKYAPETLQPSDENTEKAEAEEQHAEEQKK